MNASNKCKNCGTHLESDFKYCPSCGQEVRDSASSIGAFFTHFLNDYFTFDSKIIRSFKPLLFKPGFLTLEFLGGKRVRYITPLRLYIFISIAFFLVLSLLGSDATATDSEEAFWDAFFGNYLPKIFFLLLPLFALVLHLLYIRRKQPYVKHFVFSLHFHAFLFISTLFFLLISEPLEKMGLVVVNQVLSGILGILLLAYLFFAMKRVYQQPVGRTLLKFFLLCLGYGGILILVVSTALLLLTSQF